VIADSFNSPAVQAKRSLDLIAWFGGTNICVATERLFSLASALIRSLWLLICNTETS